MLGLDSQLSLQEQVSNLSITSNDNQQKPCKHLSANNPSTLNSQGATLSKNISNLKAEKIKQLRNKMQQISRNHQAMQTRLKSYINMAQKQVKKKQDENHQLQIYIASLKEELQQSKADFQVLISYVAKKNSAAVKEYSKYLKLNNQSSKGQLSVQSGQRSIESVQSKNHQNTTLRPKVSEKASSPSPTSKNQKKLNNNTLPINAFQRKVRSPGK